MVKEHWTDRNLQELYQKAPVQVLNPDSRIVIFSDLHIGNRTERDDFLKNSQLFLYALEKFYYRNDYTLILNGDIEELYKFPYKRIHQRWPEVFRLFKRFQTKKKLFKLVGNHDLVLSTGQYNGINNGILNALKLDYKDNEILIFHGHQVSYFFNRYNLLAEFSAKYLANPLYIKNYSTAYNNSKKFRVEKKVYEFSTKKKIVSIIGHTHRPLFESLSKADELKYKIEDNCRRYPESDEVGKVQIERDIKSYKAELEDFYQSNRREQLISSVYNFHLPIPSLFNSGCVIGKRGITAIEIQNGDISLVHWFDSNVSQKFIGHPEYHPKKINHGDYFRMVLKRDSLDYIFSRIKLVA